MATSAAVLSPANRVAASMPHGTPSAVPSIRCQPLVSVSPQELVPAKITNAAITAQNQRAGDTSSPVTIANAAAIVTWIACRVVDDRPPSGCLACSSGSCSWGLVSASCGSVSGGGASTVARSTMARTSAVALAALMIASARRRTAVSAGWSAEVGGDCRSRTTCASPAACCRPVSDGIRIDRASWVSASTNSRRVPTGIAPGSVAAMDAACRPALATHSMASSASKSHGASCWLVTPGHSTAGSALSSIWVCTISAVSLSRMVRARMWRRRRSSRRPVRTASAVVSTTIAIRARSARMVSRRTLSGSSGST